MNANKTLGFFATVLTALACLMPTTAQGVGDIRKIEVQQDRVYRAEPLRAGETVTIKVRLMNRDWPATFTNATHVNAWRLKYTGLGSEAMANWVESGRPRLGLWVSGGLRYATLRMDSPRRETATEFIGDTSSGHNGIYYTVLEFDYTVQPGDFAMPIQLANTAGTGPAMGGDRGSTDSNYFVLNMYDGTSPEPWSLVTTDDENAVCEFYFGPEKFTAKELGTLSADDAWHAPHMTGVKEARDLDLSKADVCVQAVDLDDAWYDDTVTPKIWRGIQKGTAQAAPLGMPLITIPNGGVPERMTAYIWTDDETVVEPLDNVVTKTFRVYDEATGVATGAYVDRKVGAVDILPGAEQQSFRVKAVGAVGATARVYMSFVPTNTFNYSNALLSNFVARTVQVITPPPPSITVTVSAKQLTTSTTPETPAATLNVELSEPYAEDLEVTLNFAMRSGAAKNPFDYVGIDDNMDGDYLAKNVTVRIPAGTLQPVTPYYIYANRADDETAGAGKGITVTPSVTGAAAAVFEEAYWRGAFFTIGGCNPVIVSPTEADTITGVPGNANYTYNIEIRDAAGELTQPYTVYWYNNGSGTPTIYTGVMAKTVDGRPNVLEVTHKYKNSGAFRPLVRVYNVDGHYVDGRFNVVVDEQKTVEASPSTIEVSEGAGVDIAFQFKPGSFDEDDDAYVFLVPRDEASSNLVDCSAFTRGLKIRVGDDAPAQKAHLDILDGRKNLTLSYDIVVRTEENIEDGEEVANWTQKRPLEILAKNETPHVTKVFMSGFPHTANGGTIATTAAIDVPKRFKAETDEPSQIDLDSDQFVTEWTFIDGSSANVIETQGSPFGQEVTYTFVNAGTNSVLVRMRDKDMTDVEFGKAPVFEFKVRTIDTPAIQMSPASGTHEFLETQTGATDGRILLRLTEPASAPIDVGVTVERLRADDGNYPVPEISMEVVTFKKGQTEAYFWITEMDGTKLTGNPGIRLSAQVLTDTVDPNSGKRWCDLFVEDSMVIQIRNVDPRIDGVGNTATNLWAMNVPFTIPWSVTDIDADLGEGMRAVWTCEGVTREYTGAAAASGVYTNEFTSAGLKYVSLTVYDKDGGFDSRDYIYKIQASKGLNIYPQGPKNSGQSTLASEYINSATDARGLGKGRVYADGALTKIDRFTSIWSYSPEKPEGRAWAWGYKVGDIDDGTLMADYDAALDKAGNSFKGDAAPDKALCYKYTGTRDVNGNERDSFFYAWVIASKENAESGSFPEGTANVKPYDGSATFDAEQSVTLAEFDDEAVSYQSVILEAIFSLEYYAQDNVGDINQDGVPDIDAVASKRGGKLYQLTGGEGSGASNETIQDFTDVSNYNGSDEASGDFWPKLVHTSGTYSFAPGKPFTALDEIRGVHPGLNRLNSENQMISDIWFSTEEENAAKRAYMVAHPDAADAAGWEDWVKAGNWSPECPTDPTVPDTDKDGLNDGLEYWLWYQATVNGYTGSRFTMETIGQGELIPAEVVAYAFNPTRKRPVSGMTVAYYDQGLSEVIKDANGNPWTFDAEDFDNDGLYDVEEALIGTNPAHWDTDGDGILDFWEVLHGLDPLDAVDGALGLSVTDTRNNPDMDFMARKNGPQVTVVTIHGKDGTTSWAFEQAPNFEKGEETKSVYCITTADGTYAFEEKPPVAAVAPRGFEVGKTLTGWKVLDGDEPMLIGPVTVLMGTRLTAAPDLAAPQEMNVAALKEENGLQVWAYGPEKLALYAPVSQDGVTTAEVPSGDVVAVETERQLIYIHNQVFWVDGFDPRTAWNRVVGKTFSETGFVDKRWDVTTEGGTGHAVNTEPYTSLDEFLVLRYRHEVQPTKKTEVFYAGRARAADVHAWPQQALTIFWGVINLDGRQGATTIPVFEFAKTNDVGEVKQVFGADTDMDGVPDGWELYVDFDPNDAHNARSTSADGNATSVDPDGDGLGLVGEYAGTDSCNAYSNVTTIVENHPGLTKGWYNKFFPTNPYDKDTDGDGITDSKEGQSWTSTFWVGRNSYLLPLNFIYGQITDDGSTRCFAGGGLNPCSVDTDQDLLPDLWEYEFAGVVVDSKAAKPDIQALDLQQILTRDGMWTRETNDTVFVAGGMDGTWAGDANCDFDHDGLLNYQEYLVQALRHLRYDDSETPLMGRELVDGQLSPFIKFLPMQTWDGEAFYALCQEAGFSGGSSFNYAELGYFTRPPHLWDRLAQSKLPGAKACVAYGDPLNADDPRNGYRIMLRPQGLLPTGDRMANQPAGYLASDTSSYATTDPRRWDSDDDGMDDFYELFHGLNPLLGSAQDPRNEDVAMQPAWQKHDRIAMIYGGTITAWNNAWTGWNADAFTAEWGAEIPMFDAMKYPWMMGTAEADADGDGLRNSEEALLVNQQTPVNTHTDPSPLWFTESTITNKASFVAQYYALDPYVRHSDSPDLEAGHLYYPWLWTVQVVKRNIALDGRSLDWMFSFEENEGYDTDRDFMSDGDELVRSVTPGSDPQNAYDPDRRQALYFPADPFSAAVSHANTGARSYSTESEMFKQFTVEAWIWPEDLTRDQVILERVSKYGTSTLSNNVETLRANFRLGIKMDGGEAHLYAEMDGSTADSPTQTLLWDTPLQAPTKWMHVAFSFDGSTASLYIDNQSVPVERIRDIRLIPATGVVMTEQNAADLQKTLTSTNVTEFMGYTTVPTVFVLGARAVHPNVIDLNGQTMPDNFAECFKGFIDEVRVWDGARESRDIADDCNTRYTFDDIKRNRDEVYTAWARGYRRNVTGQTGKLPPELIQHYNFSTLPGAPDPEQVIMEPLAFNAKVLDNVRIDGDLVPGGLYPGWWAMLGMNGVANEWYGNRAVIPWINNSVRHLIPLEGTTPDSWYWTHRTAGLLNVDTDALGVKEFTFPNSYNPYGGIAYSFERYVHYYRLMTDTAGGNPTADASDETKLTHREIQTRWAFDMRSGFVGTDDMVPLGGAFAKRMADYWDDHTAMDAWQYTGLDLDMDGLPDWWEAMYGGTELDKDTMVVWTDPRNPAKELNITAREAYLRDLALGLLPGGDFDAAYADARDNNKNSLPDWWEDIYGLASDDPDRDQLSNRSEYLISEGFTGVKAFNFPFVDPEKPVTRHKAYYPNQKVPDYFLRVGKLYLGEMFQDHDFMEDAWEEKYAPELSAAVYDLWSDPDDDGWSNWAECRADTDPTRTGEVSIDKITVGQHPVPILHATVKYNGQSAFNGSIVFEARRSAVSAAEIPDARWITGGASENTKFLGKTLDGTKRFVLGGGVIQRGSLTLQFKAVRWWDREGLHYLKDSVWVDFGGDTENRNAADKAASMDGIIFFSKSGTDSVKIGTINYETGEVVMDCSQISGLYSPPTANAQERPTYDLDECYLMIKWKASFPDGSQHLTIDLIDPTPDETKVGGSKTTPTRGFVREGENTVVAFLDRNSDGVWTPGEPYGVATGVGVGWNESSFTVELTDTAPQTFRINMAEALQSNNFNSQKEMNDRGVLGNPGSGNFEVVMPGEAMPEATEDNVRIRIVRSKINDVVTSKSGISADRLVYDEVIHPVSMPVFSEANIIAAKGQFDLDWDLLVSNASSMGLSGFTSVVYRVVVGDGSVSSSATNNLLATAFVNRYELSRAAVAADPEQTQIIYAGAPTFRWSHKNSINKAYPAFQMRIFDSAKKPVYDSGVQQAPARDIRGYYAWTPAFHCGDVTALGHVVSTTNNYYWTVDMLDAKFTSVTAVGSAALFPFRMNTTGDITDEKGYGSLRVNVKYMGALAENVNTTPTASNMKNVIRVQAFTTPDFAGRPVAETYVRTKSMIASASVITNNAVIKGVPPGTYYVRAYLDTDGDGAWSKWESWGYSNYVGEDSDAVYTARAWTVADGKPVPEVTVYIEDADTDFDGFPDAWEMHTNGNLTKTEPIKGNTFFATVNPNLAASLTAYKEMNALTSSMSGALGIQLMSALLDGTPGLSYQAAMLLGAGDDVTVTEVNAKITDFSLTEGLTVATDAESSTGSGLKLSSVEPCRVKWTLYYAPTLDAAFEPVDSGTVTAGETETLDWADVKAAAQKSERYSETSGFFKVGVEVVK